MLTKQQRVKKPHRSSWICWNSASKKMSIRKFETMCLLSAREVFDDIPTSSEHAIHDFHGMRSLTPGVWVWPAWDYGCTWKKKLIELGVANPSSFIILSMMGVTVSRSRYISPHNLTTYKLHAIDPTTDHREQINYPLGQQTLVSFCDYSGVSIACHYGRTPSQLLAFAGSSCMGVPVYLFMITRSHLS